MDREEWLQLHQDPEMVTASQVATVMGQNPWESPYTLFQRKKGRVPWQDESIPMRCGHALENVVAQLYEEATGRTTVDFGDYTMEHCPTVPGLSATLDRYDDTGRAVELKTASHMARDDWAKGEGPVHYLLQSQAQLMCAELDQGALACLVGNREFFHHDHDRHDKVIKLIEIRVTEWIERIRNDDPPPMDNTDSTAATLKILHPKDDGSIVERHDLAPVIERWLVLKENAATVKAEVSSLENQLKAAFGPATFLMADGFKLSYKHQHRKEHVQAASDFRVLRTSK